MFVLELPSVVGRPNAQCVQLDDVADELEPVIDASEREADAIDEVIFYLTEKDRSEVLYRIANSRKRLSHLIRCLKPKRCVVYPARRWCGVLISTICAAARCYTT